MEAEPSEASSSVEMLDDCSSNDVRRKILALRHKKKAESPASANSGIQDTPRDDPNCLTWIGIDHEDAHQPVASSSLSPTANRFESRCSDDDDDAESTVLGHYVQELPLPPLKSPVFQHLQQRRRPSYASEASCASSQESSSSAIGLVGDDTDARSSHASTLTDASSGPPSRRASSALASNASNRRCRQNSGKDSCIAEAATPTSSRPPGPPPSLPLPPKPLSSPHTRSPSAKSDDFWPSRRSSRASSKRPDSAKSFARTQASWKKNCSNLLSSPSIPTASDRSNTSDFSHDELIGIRDISKHFPSPVTPLGGPPFSALHSPRRSSSRSSNRSDAASESSRTRSRAHRTGSASRRTLSPIRDTASDLSWMTSAHGQQADQTTDAEDSDSALSDVLNFTASKGFLLLGKPPRKASLRSPVGLTRVGLGASTLFRRSSEQSIRAATKAKSEARTPDPEQMECMRDVQDERPHDIAKESQATRPNHQRSASMSKSMSELMAALDLEATERGQRLDQSDKIGLSPVLVETPRRRESHVLSGMPPTEIATPPQLPISDSIPSLSTSGSQDVSLDDSRGPATAESSLVRSSSTKTPPSPVGNHDGATETADDFRSIYSAYRGSASTWASRFTAPVLRIEDPQGDEVSDTEIDGDVSATDDVPRNRNKLSRKKSIGFEEQRVALRPRPSLSQRSASLSSKPSHSFHPTLISPQEEEDVSTSNDAPLQNAMDSADPYAFYEFSPSLPPFMPAGTSPRDLTGRGTWSSIVSRASDTLRSRQPSLTSIESLTTSVPTGPVPLGRIRAKAQAKQREADAAHRAREEMSCQFAAMSYRPFAIHDHAASFATQAQARMLTDNRISLVSNHGAGGPMDGAIPGRNTSMSSVSYASSMSPGAGDYGTRWPVAFGADQSVGTEDPASIFATNIWSLSRRPSAVQPPAKVYVEFSMQTSPQASPTRESTFETPHSLTVDDGVHRMDAQVESEARPIPAAQRGPTFAFLGTDAPLRRRKSTASILSVHNLDAELDQPGLWPSRIRAPRLSSFGRRCSEGGIAVAAASNQESKSDEESDLDVNANLEDLAEHSGMLEASRGSKRKLQPREMDTNASSHDSTDRVIAGIPARSRRISAALDRIRAQRISRSAGWVSSDDEDDSHDSAVCSLAYRKSTPDRPCAIDDVPVKTDDSVSVLFAPKSSPSGAAAKRGAASPSRLRARSPSPDLSILTNPSDDEEVLLSASLELDASDPSQKMILDEEFDMMVGQTITSRFARSTPPSSQRVSRKTSSESKHAPRDGSASAVAEDGQAVPERSVDSQQTVQQHSRSGSASTGSVIDLLQQAEEELSSTGHTIGHGSGHDVIISGLPGTIGHEPRDADSESGERVRSADLQALDDEAAVHRRGSIAADKFDDIEGDITSPSVEDTPDTRAGSEIWSSFHHDRSSMASTASTTSQPCTDDLHPGPQNESTSIIVPDMKGPGPQSATAAAAFDIVHEPSAACALPVLRRKSSGLPAPTARTALQKPRPSLPLPYKSKSASPTNDGIAAGKIAIPMPTSVRRYQSVASLRPKASEASKATSKVTGIAIPVDSALPSPRTRVAVRHSDTSGLIPSKSIRSVGGGITPSKLPSVRGAASTTSLRARAASENGAFGHVKVAPGRGRAAPRESGLPRPAPM